MTKLFNLKSQKQLRKNLQKQETEAEKILWWRLRNKQLNYRFRRQFGIGKYIVDFYCPKLKLVVEIDGETHSTKKEIEYDNLRQKFLENLGLTVKRYTNDDVKNNLYAVLNDIDKICCQLDNKPLPNPPLRKGREQFPNVSVRSETEQSIQTIKALFNKHGIRPSKKLGQHFLIDKKVIEKITKAANLSKNDLVIEVGPGIGNITKELAKKSGYVIAIEKDEKMIEILKETVSDCKNVKIIHQDILKIDVEKLVQSLTSAEKATFANVAFGENYKVVANLPYYLTSPAIRMFLEGEDTHPRLHYRLSEIILFIQKEVAERICAKPGKMNFLSTLVQFYGKPKIIAFANRDVSWPVPKVDFAILKISQISIPKIPQEHEKMFFEIIKAGFSSSRKQLANNLSEKFFIPKEQIKEIFLKLKINPNVRAQELGVGEWMKLVKNIKIQISNDKSNLKFK